MTSAIAISYYALNRPRLNRVAEWDRHKSKTNNMQKLSYVVNMFHFIFFSSCLSMLKEPVLERNTDI